MIYPSRHIVENGRFLITPHRYRVSDFWRTGFLTGSEGSGRNEIPICFAANVYSAQNFNYREK